MPPQYTQITYEEMNTFLTNQGFTLNKPPTLNYRGEDTYDKTIKKDGKTFVIRIYSSVCFETSRDVGQDAIRVLIFIRNSFGGDIKLTGNKRVNRTQNWKKNLQSRIDTWDKDIVWCDCSYPMIKRKNKSNGQEFYGCVRFPDCNITRKV